MTLAERIRTARKERQLSQEALANRAGMSLRAFRSLETGEADDPHYSTLSKLAEALGLSVSELVGEKSLVPLNEAPEKDEPGLTDAQLLTRLVTSNSEASKKRFLQYNRVMIVISALEELVDHVELVLDGDSASVQEIGSLEEVVSAQFFVHKRYARNEVLERGTSQQKAALKHEEARMDKAIAALQEAYRERLQRDDGVLDLAKYQAKKAEREKVEQLEREAGESAG